MKQGTTKQKHYSSWIGIVIVLVLAIIAVILVKRPVKDSGSEDNAIVNHNAAVNSPGKDGQVPTPKLKNSISVSEQKAGSTIDIDEVTLQKPGYVTIHEATGGKPGKIVAHSGLITAGTKQDLIIRYATKAGSSYYAMLHSDNGDGKYDETKDLPLNGSDAMPVMAMFAVVK